MCNPVFDLVKYKLCFKNKPLKIPLPTEQIITKYASYFRIASIDLVYPSTLTNHINYNTVKAPQAWRLNADPNTTDDNIVLIHFYMP